MKAKVVKVCFCIFFFKLANKFKYAHTKSNYILHVLIDLISLVVPSVKVVRNAKSRHECAVQFVKYVCEQRSSMSIDQQASYFLRNQNSILSIAIRDGIEEFVTIVLQYFPDLTNYNAMEGRNLLQAAIQFRQEKIVNIFKEMSPIYTKNMCSKVPTPYKSTLHLAGKLAPPSKLFSVSGAALQMQRELQWFEV